MLGTLLVEGIILGALLVLVCAVAIRKGAVNLVYLYEPEVQERCISLGLTTREKIKRNSIRFKLICIPAYIAYVLVCVYTINRARGFADGFWQLLAILSVMNLMDRLGIDEWWVGHTNTWTIPGTEEFKPYISNKAKVFKWMMGTVGMAVISAILSCIMTLFIH